MSSKTYLTLPVAPNEYSSAEESTFRKTVQDNLQDIANEFLDSGNHSRKDASLSLRRFQFVPTATQKPSVGEFFNLNVGGSVVVGSILDEDNMASNSATALATQQSIKAYVDASSAPIALNDLTDVTITSPSSDQVLKYNGSLWVNAAVPSVSLSSLSDVTITSVATNDYLRWSGSAWVNDPGSPAGVTQISAGAGISLSPTTITSTGTVSMDRFGFEDLTAPGASKVPFYRYTGGGSDSFDWLLFDTNDFTISATTISLAAGVVGFTDAGTGLVASGTGLVQDTVSVKYTSGSNLIDGADTGSIDGADYILFQDDSDASIVKKDTVAQLPFVDAVAGTAPIVSSGGTSPTISLNYTVALKNSGSNLVVDIETNTYDFNPSAGDTMDASDIVMLFDRGSDVDRPTPSDPGAGGTYVARLDQLDLNLMDNSNANFTANAFNAAGDGLRGSGSTINVDYVTTSNVVSDANDGTGDTVDASNDRMLIYNVTPDTANEYVQFININQLPFAQTDAIESITANWVFNADITWGDDDALQFGTSVDYWFEYNTTGTQFEFWTSDSNGSGADALLMSVSDGGTVVDFNGQVITPAIRVGGGPQASTGEVKLSYTDTIAWRNATNTADVVALTVDDTDNLLNTSTTFRPDTDGLRDLGTTAIRWRHIYADDITVSSGLVTSVGEATNGGIAISPTSGDVLLGIRLTGTDNYILEAPDQQGVAIATSARVAYSDGSNDVQYGNVSDLPFPSKTGAETISGNWTVTGEWTFSNDLTLEATVPRLYFRESDQAADEKVYRMVVTGSNFKFQARNDADTANTDIFEVDRGAGVAVNAVDFHVNIRPDTDGAADLGTNSIRWGNAYIDTLTLTNPLAYNMGGTGLSDSPANDELLVSLGPGNGWEASGTGLTWTGSTLNATAFSGDGSALTNVAADTSAVGNLTTEVATYYPMVADGTSGNVSHYVNSTDLRWKNTASANQLLLADGAAATPIIGFISDEDTGVYLSGTAQLSFAAGGTEKLRVATSGPISYDDLTVELSGTSNSNIYLKNATGTRGYIQAQNSGLVTLATEVAGGQINLRDNANGLNLIQADYNGTDTVRINSNGNNSFAINATGTATSAILRWRFGGTDEARIQWLGSGGSANQLRVRLEDSTDRYSIFIGGASGANDRRFDIQASADHTGVVAIENAQLYVDEYGTQYEDTGSVTIEWDKGNQQLIDFDSTSTTTTIDINSGAMEAGGSYILLLQYNSGSSQTIAWTSGTPLLWANGDEPTSTYTAGTAGDITVVQFFKTTVATDKIIGSYYIVT